MIFGDSNTFINSASESILPFMSPYMVFLRIGEVVASILLFVIGLFMTDWRNEGYAWFLHNSIMGVTVLATIGLLLSTILREHVYYVMNDFAMSFYTFSLAA